MGRPRGRVDGGVRAGRIDGDGRGERYGTGRPRRAGEGPGIKCLLA